MNETEKHKMLKRALREPNYFDRYVPFEINNESDLPNLQKATRLGEKRMTTKEKDQLKKHCTDMISWLKENNKDYDHYLKMMVVYKLV